MAPSGRTVQSVKGIVFLTMLFLGAFLGVGFFHVIISPWFLFQPVVYKKTADQMVTSWMVFCAGLLELFLGVKVKVTGDIIQHGERNMIIMNHRTRLDWMYFWSVLVRQSGTATEKIILKSPLKALPGFGWAMQVASFIFIERKWDEDKKIFMKLLDYFISLKHKTQVLLFPEGTDFTERNKTKSDEFARKNNVEPFNYVLHPRTTGFTFLTQYLMQREHLDAVYDVTVGYPQNIPQNEMDLAVGNFPREVHFHIKRHVIQTLPISEEGLAQWCKTRWEEKELRLKEFYEKKSFEDTDNIPKKRVNGESDQAAPKEDYSEKTNYLRNERLKQEHRGKSVMQIMTICWIIFIVTISVILYASSLARWLVAAEVCMFVFITKKYRGFEFIQADYFKWFNRNTKKAKKVG